MRSIPTAAYPANPEHISKNRSKLIWTWSNNVVPVVRSYAAVNTRCNTCAAGSIETLLDSLPGQAISLTYLQLKQYRAIQHVTAQQAEIYHNKCRR
jgi:hypothetical protein